MFSLKAVSIQSGFDPIDLFRINSRLFNYTNTNFVAVIYCIFLIFLKYEFLQIYKNTIFYNFTKIPLINN